MSTETDFTKSLFFSLRNIIFKNSNKMKIPFRQERGLHYFDTFYFA